MSENLNPMANIFKEFNKIIENVVIKYNYKAEEYETLETKASAEEYFDAINKKDNFYTYRDYEKDELEAVGISDPSVIQNVLEGNSRTVPIQYQEALLALRRARVINNFEEKNNYYRTINGYPELNDTEYFYVSQPIANRLGIDITIPIHKIQDYYNRLNGRGDYYITTIEALEIIDDLIEKYPDKEYLKYIGTNRVDLENARTAKNFAILKLSQSSIRASVYERFLTIYEQCRVYFINTSYNAGFRSFIDYYDNFIAMSIMTMAICQMIMHQIPLTIKREYFDVYSVRLLYEAYDIPFNINIDEYTQRNIAQRLNLLVQNKSTNKVIFDIAELLGFSTINVYKYYLVKERNFDNYGAPIIAETTTFNAKTAEMETVPDYQKMYNLYFQKVDINEQDVSQAFNSNVNRVEYEDVVENDPYWWKDDNGLQEQLWNREYSYIESKYLGLGISYKLSEIMFENILLLKMFMQKESELATVNISLPKIYPEKDVSVFDAIVMLCCLTCKKHKLKGEIISVPSQITAVLDYMRNLDIGDEMSVNTFAFNFEYFKDGSDGQKAVEDLLNILGEAEGKEFLSYINILNGPMGIENNDKIMAINNMYQASKNLYNFINYQIAAAKDRKTYEALKTFFSAAYYSKEMKSTFSINIETENDARTAWTYFEFLHWKNPKFYNSIFTANEEGQYLEYLEKNNLTQTDYTIVDYDKDVDSGKLQIKYDTLKDEMTSEDSTTDTLLYYYIDHIISRIEEMIEGLKYIYLINDASSPLTDLLTRLIRFFKSYTVDMLDLDVLFVCNIKLDNIIRFFDEIYYINKTITPKDQMNISYADVINIITANISHSDKMTLKDWYQYEVTMYCDTFMGKKFNEMYMSDIITYMDKTITAIKRNDNRLRFYDTIKLNPEIHPKEKQFGLSDKIIKIWESDPEDE